MTPASDSLPNKLFGYEVLACIGQGAGSKLYAVNDPASQQLYALKHVRRNVDSDQRFIDQLENEYRIAHQIQHPNLRRAIQVKHRRNVLWQLKETALLLEMVDGLPLEKGVPQDLARLVHCFVQTAQAMEAMHTAGFVHCDLKPQNILLGSDGQVKVIDLGQACRIGTAKERIQGTPDYIAPEQVRRQPLTAQTDIYNFGASLYWALCQRNLPTIFTLSASQSAYLVDSQVPRPTAINPLVPQSLSDLTMHCVQSNPRRRPADMADVIHRLSVIHRALRQSSRDRTPAPRA